APVQLDRAQQLVLELMHRTPTPQLIWDESVDNRRVWMLLGSNTLLWVVDEGAESLVRERTVDSGLARSLAGAKAQLPADLLRHIARVTPKLSADAKTLAWHLPLIQAPEQGPCRLVVGVFEGKGPDFKVMLYTYQSPQPALIPRGTLSRRSYGTLFSQTTGGL